VSQRSSVVAGQSRLVSVAKQSMLNESIVLSEETEDPDARIPVGIWACPTIGLAGPARSTRHTGGDLPALIHPKYLAGATAALDRLVRAL
jgi:hypothetical protein